MRKKRNPKYAENEFSDYKEETKGHSKVEESKKTSVKASQNSKNQKNPEVEFSSDEELEILKEKTKFDLRNLGTYPYTAKKLLENPEELEGLDVKQYYDNPVRL